MTYTYKKNGSRGTRVLGGPAGFTETYTYDAGDRLTQVMVDLVTGTDYSKVFTYDGGGRCTKQQKRVGVIVTETKNYVWDSVGRMKNASYLIGSTQQYNVSHTYNGLHARTGKTGTSGTFNYKRSGATVMAPIVNDGAASYTPGVSERRGGVSKWSHSGIKNADLQTSASATITAGFRYDAFGDAPLAQYGAWSGPFRYGGDFGYHAETADSGLQQLGNRWYDTSLGRFLSRDPMKSGRNWYSYCSNNPVNLGDPSGQQSAPGSGAIGFGSGAGKGFVMGLAKAQKYTDSDGQIVLGMGLYHNSKGRPLMKQRSFHIDAPHGPLKDFHFNAEIGPLSNLNHSTAPAAWLGKAKVFNGVRSLLGAASVRADGVAIFTSSDPVAEAVKSATVWGVGAEIGTGICPGLGTIVGGIIGGAVTGAIVYWND